MSDTQPNVDELRSLMARAGADEETIEQIMQQGVYPCISQAKKDLLAEVRGRMPEGRELYHNPPSQNGDWYDSGFNAYRAQALAAIKEVEEGL